MNLVQSIVSSKNAQEKLKSKKTVKEKRYTDPFVFVHHPTAFTGMLKDMSETSKMIQSQINTFQDYFSSIPIDYLTTLSKTADDKGSEPVKENEKNQTRVRGSPCVQSKGGLVGHVPLFKHFTDLATEIQQLVLSFLAPGIELFRIMVCSKQLNVIGKHRIIWKHARAKQIALGEFAWLFPICNSIAPENDCGALNTNNPNVKRRKITMLITSDDLKPDSSKLSDSGAFRDQTGQDPLLSTNPEYNSFVKYQLYGQRFVCCAVTDFFINKFIEQISSAYPIVSELDLSNELTAIDLEQIVTICNILHFIQLLKKSLFDILDIIMAKVLSPDNYNPRYFTREETMVLTTLTKNKKRKLESKCNGHCDEVQIWSQYVLHSKANSRIINDLIIAEKDKWLIFLTKHRNVRINTLFTHGIFSANVRVQDAIDYIHSKSLGAYHDGTNAMVNFTTFTSLLRGEPDFWARDF